MPGKLRKDTKGHPKDTMVYACQIPNNGLLRSTIQQTGMIHAWVTLSDDGLGEGFLIPMADMDIIPKTEEDIQKIVARAEAKRNNP